MDRITEKEALKKIAELAGKENIKIDEDSDSIDKEYLKTESAFKQEYEKRLEMMKPKSDKEETSLPEQSEFEINVWQLTSAMTNLLCYKNKRYGNAALDPIGIFNKHPELGSIPTRIDDKLSRIKNSENFRVNDICDLIGYLYLLLLAMGVKKEDIERLKD